MKAMMATSSLGLGAVPPPPLMVVNNASQNILINLNEVLALSLCELG
jgi:hypothetical protein